MVPHMKPQEELPQQSLLDDWHDAQIGFQDSRFRSLS